MILLALVKGWLMPLAADPLPLLATPAIVPTITTIVAAIGGAMSILIGYLRWGREDVGKAAETASKLIDTMKGVNDEIEDAMKRLRQERDDIRAECESCKARVREFKIKMDAAEARADEYARKLDVAEGRAVKLEAEIQRLESLLAEHTKGNTRGGGS